MNSGLDQDSIKLIERLDRALTKNLYKALKSMDEEEIKAGIEDLSESIILGINNMGLIMSDVDTKFTIASNKTGDSDKVVINIIMTVHDGMVRCGESDCELDLMERKDVPGLNGFCLRFSASLEDKEVKIGILTSTHEITGFTNIPFSKYIVLHTNPKITFLGLPSYIKYKLRYWCKVLKGKIDK